MLYKELNEMKLRVILIIAVLVISLITTIVMRPYASQMMSEMAGQLVERVRRNPWPYAAAAAAAVIAIVYATRGRRR